MSSKIAHWETPHSLLVQTFVTDSGEGDPIRRVFFNNIVPFGIVTSDAAYGTLLKLVAHSPQTSLFYTDEDGFDQPFTLPPISPTTPTDLRFLKLKPSASPHLSEEDAERLVKYVVFDWDGWDGDLITLSREDHFEALCSWVSYTPGATMQDMVSGDVHAVGPMLVKPAPVSAPKVKPTPITVHATLAITASDIYVAMRQQCNPKDATRYPDGRWNGYTISFNGNIYDVGENEAKLVYCRQTEEFCPEPRSNYVAISEANATYPDADTIYCGPDFAAAMDQARQYFAKTGAHALVKELKLGNVLFHTAYTEEQTQ